MQKNADHMMSGEISLLSVVLLADWSTG